MGQLTEDKQTSIISKAISDVLKPYIPTLGKQVLNIIKPAAEESVKIVKPSVIEAIKENLPTFSVLTGVIVASLVLSGIFLGKKIWQ